MAILVCFAGQIGSGKTSISTAVAEALQWKRAGFGDFLRAEMIRRGGDPTHRESLQDLGQSYVHEGAESFCRQVLASGKYSPQEHFILDGVRHVDIHFALERLVAPNPVRLIFLMSGNELRKQRVTARDGSSSDLARAESHPVEADLRANLPALAAIEIDASAAIDDVVRQSLDIIQSWLAE